MGRILIGLTPPEGLLWPEEMFANAKRSLQLMPPESKPIVRVQITGLPGDFIVGPDTLCEDFCDEIDKRRAALTEGKPMKIFHKGEGRDWPDPDDGVDGSDLTGSIIGFTILFAIIGLIVWAILS